MTSTSGQNVRFSINSSSTQCQTLCWVERSCPEKECVESNFYLPPRPPFLHASLHVQLLILIFLHLLNLLVSLSRVMHNSICWALGVKAQRVEHLELLAPTIHITPQAFQAFWCLTATLPPPLYSCLWWSWCGFPCICEYEIKRKWTHNLYSY